MINKEIFHELLKAYWLRPESALWYSEMITLAPSFGVGAANITETLDFGCMDGVNSYVLMGGIIPDDFDAFEDIPVDQNMHRKFSLRNDYYDNSLIKSSHVFDAPKSKFMYGIDWKESHISRARHFNTHSNIFRWTQGSEFPVAVNNLQMIWAPNLYWMQDVAHALSQFGKNLSDNGQIVTIVPRKRLLDYLALNWKVNAINREWLSMFDRGRHENAIRSARSTEEWSQFFEESGLYVTKTKGFISPQLISVYEMGMRPMFSPLLHMRALLAEVGSESLSRVKSEWVESLQNIFYPLLDDGYFDSQEENSLWSMVSLRKI